jgi:hypothetical protein
VSIVAFDPRSLDLEELFVDPDMFESRDAFRDAGFEVFKRSSDNTIMVASHPSAKGYLFKKYYDKISLKEQLENYEQRLEGVRRLKALIDAQHLEHIAVPKKWLYELPSEFASHKHASYVLIVERFSLLDDKETKRAYARIDKDVLRELCIVCFAFTGLDSSAGNVPFTEDGQIAFIDTEHWERHSKRENKKPYLRHIHKYLSEERMSFANKIFEELEDA